MVEQDRKRPYSALRRFVQESAAAAEASLERCELCSEPIPSEHRHLLEVTAREVACVCRACSILFDKEAASMGKYRLVPDRQLLLADFQMSDAQWEDLRIPVNMAFIFYSTPTQQVTAYYPSPAGPTQSLLSLDMWQNLEEHNPVLKEMQRDVEALLINRARGAYQHFLVPIDECYRLVGLIRMHWRGLSGGQQVWNEIEQFFESLKKRSKVHA